MGDPTDPNAGTDRNNAVSRDNLMNGAGLKYDGYYLPMTLEIIGIGGVWWSSIIRDANRAYFLSVNIDNGIFPLNNNSKSIGRAVR